MSFITLTDRSGLSLTFNTDNIDMVSDIIEDGSGTTIFTTSGIVEVVNEDYLDVIGMLKGAGNGCCRS